MAKLETCPGWSVFLTQRGTWRASRRIGGKSYSVYLGSYKEDLEFARKTIAEYCKKRGITPFPAEGYSKEQVAKQIEKVDRITSDLVAQNTLLKSMFIDIYSAKTGSNFEWRSLQK